MASKEMTPEQLSKIIASRLHDEYNKSEHVPVHVLYRDGGSLKTGDIVYQKLARYSSGARGKQFTTGSYSGPTVSSSGIIFDHYAIYHKSIGNDEHELIEKRENKDDRGTYIWKFIVSTDQLKQDYKIVIDCRYTATCEMALKIYNEKLDVGYSFSHSNCEHFVMFCLTRHGHYSRSPQARVATGVRDTFALITVPIGGIAKTVTHPFYKMVGDMDLDSRLLKTALPFGLDSDEIVNGIKDGSKIFIGHSVRAIPEPWFPHD